MESIWDLLGLELSDRVMSATSLNDEQIRLLAEGLQPCERIVDLCIGFGNLAKVLVEQGKTVYGVDIAKKSLDYARQKVGDGKTDRLYLIKGDAQRLMFSGVDGVSCVSSLGFPNLDPVANGIFNALKQGGYVAVTGLESSKIPQCMEHQGLELRKKYEEGSLRLTKEEIMKFVEASAKGMITGGMGDSSERVIAAFERQSLRISQVSSFYHDTAYFILAQKA